MSVAPVPTPDTRWRCSLCGNLTRFDVTRTTRARDYVHLDLAGDSSIEEHEVLEDSIEEVQCRWCTGVETVELVPRADSDDGGPGSGRADGAAGGSTGGRAEGESPS